MVLSGWQAIGRWAAVGFILVWGVGCKPPAQGGAAATNADGHAHDQHEGEEGHQHPENFADAVKEIGELIASVREPLSKGEEPENHDALHEIGHVLGDLPELIEKETAWEVAERDTLKGVADELFGHFAEIDKKLHGEEGKSFSELEGAIDELMKKLRRE